MPIADSQIEEVKARTDIASLVSSYGFQLRQKGGDLWCCCPFHQEKTPSFKVDVSRGTFHCFGCGESGDALAFVMRQEGLTFGEALKKLADAAGIELRATENPNARIRKRLYELMSALATDFNKMLRSPRNTDGEPAREYLKARSIDSETINKFLIGYAPKEVDKILAWAGRHGYSYQDLIAAGIIKAGATPEQKPYFYFSNRLMFSIKDKNGQVVAFSGRQIVEDKKSGKYVNSPETLIFKKSHTFFAFSEARKHIVKAPNREAIICEGQIDCIRLHTNGFPTAIAPLGTAFTEDHAVMLHRVADSAVLCFDDDGAGHKATIRTAQILLAEGMPIRVLALPDGNDPDSYILKNGKSAFEKLLKNGTESIVQFQIRAESAKESTPLDSNAQSRIVKAVLDTIAKAKDRVYRTLLLKETAKRLSLEYQTLVAEVSDRLKSIDKEQEKDENSLVEQFVGMDAAESNNLPNNTEGAFLNFLFSSGGTEIPKRTLEELIPTTILKSQLTKKLYSVFIADEQDGKPEEKLRDVVEGLSTEEYLSFINLILPEDINDYDSVPPKKKVVYFARQLWNEYYRCLLKKNTLSHNEKNSIVNFIKGLFSKNIKEVVHLLTHTSPPLSQWFSLTLRQALEREDRRYVWIL